MTPSFQTRGARGTEKNKMGGPARQRKRRGNAPTLGDVAKHAGVSSMTVSRVINGAGTVREETRRIVNAAIREIGY